MTRVVKITLGDDVYEVPRITMGQTEELSEFWEKSDSEGFPLDDSGGRLKGKALISHTMRLASIVLRDAKPKIENIKDVRCDLGDLQNAIGAVLAFRDAKDVSGNEEAGAKPAA